MTAPTLTAELLPAFVGELRRSGQPLPTPRTLADAVQPPVDLGQLADGTPIMRAIPNWAAPVFEWMTFPVREIKVGNETRRLRSYVPLTEVKGESAEDKPVETPIGRRMLSHRDECAMFERMWRGRRPDAFELIALDLRLQSLEARDRARADARNRSWQVEQRRRAEAARNPLVVIAPRGSVPDAGRVIEFLERRTRLNIDEIRSTFRQGRRSPEQGARRVLVDDAISALFDRIVVHPAAGTPQYRKAREEWWTMCPGGLARWRAMQTAIATAWGSFSFSDVQNEDNCTPLARVEFWDEWGSRPPRLPKKRMRPHELLTAVVAEALNISGRTIRRSRS